MDWVTANHIKPAVANMSLGGPVSQAIDDAVKNSIAAGVTYVVAAMNDKQDACNVSPARAPNTITVGATTNSDVRSSFSNYGACVNIFAPGSGITSAWFTSDSATNTINGTSMATPHVAGVAALYLEANPGATPAMVSSAIIGNATANKLSNVGTGSPNLMLYSRLGGGAGTSETLSTDDGATYLGPIQKQDGTPTNLMIRAVVSTGGGGNCAFTISPTSRNITAAGALGLVNVTTSAGCNLTATSNANFITVLPPASGSGAGCQARPRGDRSALRRANR